MQIPLPYRAVALIVTFAFALAGCSKTRPFTGAPRINYGQTRLYESIDPKLKTTDFEVFYVTDRASDRTGPHGPEYGYQRNRGTTYGVANCGLNKDITWDQLVELSTTDKSHRGYSLEIKSVEELGQLSPTVELLEVRDGRTELKPDAMQTLEKEQRELHAALTRWLDRTPCKDAYVNVHGFNTGYEGSVLRPAEYWHFMGRPGVPIAYSWPAGRGTLRGYAYDRESGEFTIVHLKLLLLALSKCPQIERVHVIAHSRGTDVATTALREMNINCRSRGVDPQKELKLETLVLAAPDLDKDVFVQRFFGENMMNMANRTVIYYSSKDTALGFASWLFTGTRRMGKLRPEDFPPRWREVLPKLPRIQFVDCDLQVEGLETHNYVFSDPAALSDLILVLRDRRNAGIANGRPLQPMGDGLWRLDNTYLQSPAPATAPAIAETR